MKKNACVLVADGSEEMEVVIVVDILRRAGVGVFLAGVGGNVGTVTTSRGVRLEPDGAWDPSESGRFDALVIPGGLGGTEVMRQDDTVLQGVREFLNAGKIVAAICAGPTVLQAAGVLENRSFTSHPSVRSELPAERRLDEPVVRDGNLITSQAPGTAFAFALALVEILADSATARAVADGMRYKA